MFMRHLGLGVGHGQYGTQQEVDAEIGPDNGNDEDAEEMDDDHLSVDVDDSDNESEGEVFASGSDDNSDDGSDEGPGCDSDDLGYASF